MQFALYLTVGFLGVLTKFFKSSVTLWLQNRSINSNISSLGCLDFLVRSQYASVYLLNGFVHFLSSLDLSELAKAAKKKLQSVSISSLGTPVGP